MCGRYEKNPPHGRAADHVMQELFFFRKER